MADVTLDGGRKPADRPERATDKECTPVHLLVGAGACLQGPRHSVKTQWVQKYSVLPVMMDTEPALLPQVHGSFLSFVWHSFIRERERERAPSKGKEEREQTPH